MTYYIIQCLGTSSGPVTLKEAFEYVKGPVKEYVSKRFPGAAQEPVLLGETPSAVYVRP